MIEVTTEKYRFFTGENINYTDASISWLQEQANLATDKDMRTYAAAGIVRALLDSPTENRDQRFIDSLGWATRFVHDVQVESEILTLPTSDFIDLVAELPPVNGVLDATSLLATKSNRPLASAKLIENFAPEEGAKLVIGLGHGGIMSSLKTFGALSGEDNIFYPVRFSKYKTGDTTPALSDIEIEYLQRLALDRSVVIHDEDRGLSLRGTMTDALRFFDALLDTQSLGFTPVLARHPNDFWPQIRQIRKNYSVMNITYEPWSDGLKQFLEPTTEDKESLKT